MASLVFYPGGLEDPSPLNQNLSSKKELNDENALKSPTPEKHKKSPHSEKDSKFEYVGLLNSRNFVILKNHSVESFLIAKNTISKSMPPQVFVFFKSPFCWALFLAILSFSGPGIMFINNCGTLVKMLLSSDYTTDSDLPIYTMDDFETLKNSIVANQSLYSFIGRIASGILSDILTNYLRIPVVALLLLSVSLMYSAQKKISNIRSIGDLNIISSYVGLSMGSLFSLAPSYASEIWGPKNFGVIYGIISIGPSIGAHICNSFFGTVWDTGLSKNLSTDGLGDATTSSMQTGEIKISCDSRCTIPVVQFNLKLLSISFLCFFILLICTIFKRK
ncbi:putative transporter MCH1 [Smittium mucronatum]|uniref:Putative transporter MCH1 n=1 Tax=Smittium mucronatum TaxID=133383 RepID=A0A1R0H5T2_9FUNG|nr:putative transporter MCH1 [Smittium mucronatum]